MSWNPSSESPAAPGPVGGPSQGLPPPSAPAAPAPLATAVAPATGQGPAGWGAPQGPPDWTQSQPNGWGPPQAAAGWGTPPVAPGWGQPAPDWGQTAPGWGQPPAGWGQATGPNPSVAGGYASSNVQTRSSHLDAVLAPSASGQVPYGWPAGTPGWPPQTKPKVSAVNWIFGGIGVVAVLVSVVLLATLFLHPARHPSTGSATPTGAAASAGFTAYSDPTD